MAVLSLRSLLAERQHAAVLLGTQAAETAMKRRIQREGRIKLLTLPLSTITRLVSSRFARRRPASGSIL
jgi:hypothetical protein